MAENTEANLDLQSYKYKAHTTNTICYGYDGYKNNQNI